MQLASQHRVNIQSQILKYTLKTLWLIFFVLLVISFVFGLIASYQSELIHPTELLIGLMIIIVPFILGWLIDKKLPGHRIALLFLVMAYSSSISMIADSIIYFDAISDATIAPLISSIVLTVHHTMWIPGILFSFFLVPLYFPNGKLLSKRWRIPVMIVIADVIWTFIAITLHPWPSDVLGVPDTRALNGITGSGHFFDLITMFFASISAPLLLLVPLALLLRYRRSVGIERLQMKWPIFAIVFCFTIGFSVLSVPGLSELDARWDYPITWGLAMLFPTSIGIAILRHNLFDIDIIINRTLVYGIFTALIVALYVAMVSMLGILVEAQTTVLNGLVATGVVAVIFQPLRDRLQKIVNRLLYGERDNPEIVLSRLAQHLETADTSSTILPNLVQTVAHTLKIPYVAIWLATDNDKMEVFAEYGAAPEEREMIALIYQNKIIGNLVVAPRSPQEKFSANERKLLTTIAALTATTVRSVQLSDELRLSRQRIVTAREEERRRIRRDLHDGLGPQLASQTLGLEAVAQLMPTNPAKAQSLLVSLQSQAEEAISDVRRLVYDLRPPALDDLGLIGALKQSASRYETGKLHFRFEIRDNLLEELPAAIETAIYRIAQEAMINVVRHADATQCTIRLDASDDEIMLEIEDNGCGLPEDYQSGVGLLAMQERAAELNGQVLVGALSEGGTRVQTRLALEVYRE